jgi:hypothetical protein
VPASYWKRLDASSGTFKSESRLQICWRLRFAPRSSVRRCPNALNSGFLERFLANVAERIRSFFALCKTVQNSY